MPFIKHVFVAFGIIVFAATSCNKTKKEEPVVTSPPTVTTSEVSNITPTTAVGGGMITLNIGDAVIAGGVCYSKVNNTPSISDDTTKWITEVGKFTGQLANLTPGTTYYVRAYAINKAGPGYGKVVTFRTGAANVAPVVKSSIIFGDAKVAERIVVRYTWFDADNDHEGSTRFQWYIANDTTGAPVTPVANAIDSIYTPIAGDQNKFLRVGIIPEALTGANPGTEAKSAWVGPVGAPEPTSVTFAYNGQNVTYGILTSAITHRKWLNRNLGAPNVAGAYDDWQNMGDLFQWGRKADGHQLVNRAATSNATTAVNGTTTTLSLTDDVGHSQFIIATTAPFDWHTPQKGDLWQQSGGVNNVCPAGWHVPSRIEWEAEQLGTVQDAYNKLKITTGGSRKFNDGEITGVFTSGLYWTSTVFSGSILSPYSFNLSVAAHGNSSTGNVQTMGYSVRCIKD